MKLGAPPPLAFVTFLLILLFTITIFGSAIPNPTPTDFVTARRSLLEARNSRRDPLDCGSSPFQTPCNSATSVHLPFRSVFKLPVLLLNAVGFVSKQVRAAAVPIPASNNVESLNLEARDPPDCGSSPFQTPCSATSGLKVPSIFKIPSLFFKALALAGKSITIAIPNGPNLAGLQVEQIKHYCESDPDLLICSYLSSASSLHIPSMLSFPLAIFNSIGSLPGAYASAIPSVKHKRSEVEALSPSVELARLSRSINPSLESLRSSVENDEFEELLMGRAYPDYCQCDEDGCGRSPACCANGSCWAAPTLQSAAPTQCALGGAWVGIMAFSVGFAELI